MVTKIFYECHWNASVSIMCAWMVIKLSIKIPYDNLYEALQIQYVWYRSVVCQSTTVELIDCLD